MVKKNKLFLIIIFVTIIFLSFSASYFQWFDKLENITYDWRCTVQPPRSVNKDIVIIEIAEDTLEKLQAWPLPRDYHASLIDVLSQFGARQIIIDILFSEPTPEDSLFIESIKNAGNVFLSYAFKLPSLTLATTIEPNIKQAAKNQGYINVLTDSDGKRRRVPLVVDYNGQLRPHMALLTASDYLGVSIEECMQKIPVDAQKALYVSFAGNWVSTFRHYSYVDILSSFGQLQEGKDPIINLNELKDAVCFLGVTATGSVEIGPVPIENAYPMIGIHANVMNAIIQNHFITRLGRIGNLIILFGLLLCLILFGNRLSPGNSLVFVCGLIASYAFLAIAFFIYKNMWIDMVCPSISIVSIYFIIVLRKFFLNWKIRTLLEKELFIAQDIQESFLPQTIEVGQGLECDAHMYSARFVGGDFFDVISLPNDKTCFFIGDVCGKGVGASLIMARVISMFRLIIRTTLDTKKIVEMLNEELVTVMKEGKFITLIVGIYDHVTSELRFCNAGHVPAMHITNTTSQMLEKKSGLPVGITTNTVYCEELVYLQSEDLLFLYTDAFVESGKMRKYDDPYKELLHYLQDQRKEPIERLREKIIQRYGIIKRKEQLQDDVTCIIVKKR